MTAAEHDRFAFDDGAYLLGALEPADRQAYEQHLADCPLCQASLAELTGLPAVLERADPEMVLDGADLGSADPDGGDLGSGGFGPGQRGSSGIAGPVPPTLLPRLLAEVGHRRTRRVIRAATVGFLAACLLVAIAFGGVRVWSDNHRPPELALQAVGPNPVGVYANVRLVGDGSDTRIKLDCGYPAATAGSYPSYAPSYRMVVVNRAGQTRELGSWSPQPGEDVQLTRTSPWHRDALAGIEIADQRGTVVLRLSL